MMPTPLDSSFRWNDSRFRTMAYFQSLMVRRRRMKDCHQNTAFLYLHGTPCDYDSVAQASLPARADTQVCPYAIFIVHGANPVSMIDCHENTRCHPEPVEGSFVRALPRKDSSTSLGMTEKPSPFSLFNAPAASGHEGLFGISAWYL